MSLFDPIDPSFPDVRAHLFGREECAGVPPMDGSLLPASEPFQDESLDLDPAAPSPLQAKLPATIDDPVDLYAWCERFVADVEETDGVVRRRFAAEWWPRLPDYAPEERTRQGALQRIRSRRALVAASQGTLADTRATRSLSLGHAVRMDRLILLGKGLLETILAGGALYAALAFVNPLAVLGGVALVGWRVLRRIFPVFREEEFLRRLEEATQETSRVLEARSHEALDRHDARLSDLLAEVQRDGHLAAHEPVLRYLRGLVRSARPHRHREAEDDLRDAITAWGRDRSARMPVLEGCLLERNGHASMASLARLSLLGLLAEQERRSPGSRAVDLRHEVETLERECDAAIDRAYRGDAGDASGDEGWWERLKARFASARAGISDAILGTAHLDVAVAAYLKLLGHAVAGPIDLVEAAGPGQMRVAGTRRANLEGLVERCLGALDASKEPARLAEERRAIHLNAAYLHTSYDGGRWERVADHLRAASGPADLAGDPDAALRPLVVDAVAALIRDDAAALERVAQRAAGAPGRGGPLRGLLTGRCYELAGRPEEATTAYLTVPALEQAARTGGRHDRRVRAAVRKHAKALRQGASGRLDARLWAVWEAARGLRPSPLPNAAAPEPWSGRRFFLGDRVTSFPPGLGEHVDRAARLRLAGSAKEQAALLRSFSTTGTLSTDEQVMIAARRLEEGATRDALAALQTALGTLEGPEAMLRRVLVAELVVEGLVRQGRHGEALAWYDERIYAGVARHCKACRLPLGLELATQTRAALRLLAGTPAEQRRARRDLAVVGRTWESHGLDKQRRINEFYLARADRLGLREEAP